jgi:hypothetical protein
MADRRRANVHWDVAEENGQIPSWERVGIAVLMDIRDELQRLNALLHCENFTGIPRTLKSIQRKLPTRRTRTT